ncbi:hypothetical protein QF034_007480 [Streptomyces africanus]|uniref:Uncharacterized protein n=1 Tax=Streptomyces africanus TaxID=231024 RepID=A0ABU0R0R5_9ACTN|nr:hypothetical protein [Streptomyces africanus]MDQ0753249.1 hypothetical protein [Streptomyces africanus]
MTHLRDGSAGSTRVLVDGRLDAHRRAGTAGIRFEAVGSATTIRLRDVRLVR